jgi:hypothetical protein
VEWSLPGKVAKTGATAAELALNVALTTKTGSNQKGNLKAHMTKAEKIGAVVTELDLIQCPLAPSYESNQIFISRPPDCELIGFSYRF